MSEQQMTLTADYFLEEYHRFRELMGLKSTTVKFLLEAFGALTYVYFNVLPEEYERVETSFIALKDEVDRRIPYMLTRELRKNG